MWAFFQAGGPLMWPLLLCSIAALAVTLDRCLFWAGLHEEADLREAEALLRSIEKGEEPARVGAGLDEEKTGVVTGVLAAGLRAASADRAMADRAMQVAAMRALAPMRRGLTTLDTLITVAPMLGIIGTVLGIIDAFEVLGQSGAAEPRLVVSALGEALITTVSGLAISVMAVFPFKYFTSRLERMEDLMEIHASRLELALRERPCA